MMEFINNDKWDINFVKYNAVSKRLLIKHLLMLVLIGTNLKNKKSIYFDGWKTINSFKRDKGREGCFTAIIKNE